MLGLIMATLVQTAGASEGITVLSCAGTTGPSSIAFATIELREDGARVRVPREILPDLASGGSDGWWPVYDLTIDDDALRGRLRLNLIERPKISIDRRSGEIRITGSSAEFAGVCRRVDAKPVF